MKRSALLPIALALCAACCLAVGLAACGDDDGDTTTVTETQADGTASTEETDSSESTDAGTSTDPLPPESQGTEGPAFFKTPSRNIGCSVSKQGARCDIAERDWKPTPATEPCRVDYGNGISLNTNGAQFTCAGDTTLGAPNTLEYGQRAQRGKFFCDSTNEGVTCSNLETGAGFFISRASYRIF